VDKLITRPYSITSYYRVIKTMVVQLAIFIDGQFPGQPVPHSTSQAINQDDSF